MRIFINGKEHDAVDGSTVFDLLIHLGFEPDRVVVEHNTRIVKRPDFDTTSVHDGDQLELLQFVGGG